MNKLSFALILVPIVASIAEEESVSSFGQSDLLALKQLLYSQVSPSGAILDSRPVIQITVT